MNYLQFYPSHSQASVVINRQENFDNPAVVHVSVFSLNATQLLVDLSYLHLRPIIYEQTISVTFLKSLQI